MRKWNWKNGLPYAVLGLGCLCMVVRAFFGVDIADESFYLAAAKRFASGARPFREEWFTTQLIGVLLLPLYSLYVRICGSRDGVMLFVRLCYVLFSGGIAYYLYHILRKKDGLGQTAALMAALTYLFHVRANIPTLSYYSMGLGTFLIYLCLRRRAVSALGEFCAGVSLSVSVLCMPYMILYFLCIVAADIFDRRATGEERKLGRWLYVGILCSAAVFLIYCLSSGDVMDLPGNFVQILQDPEHQDTILGSLTGFLWFMKRTFYRFLFWPMVAEFVLIGVWYGRKCRDDRFAMLLKWAAYGMFFVQSVYLRTFFEGGILIAFLLLGMQIALLNRQARWPLVRRYLLPGLLFGTIWMLGSNVGQRVFNMGCVVADIWALQIVWTDIRENAHPWSWIKSAAPAALVAVLFLIRMCDVYWDSSVFQLDTVVSRGAAKGLRTTAYRAERYEDMLENLEKYAGAGKKLAVIGVHPWVNLAADADCGALSVWRANAADPRNESYYEKYPEMVPDVILLVNTEYETYEAWRFSSHVESESDERLPELDGWFLELVEEKGYERHEENCGVFYVKP